MLHPHVHCLVTGGGRTSDGPWKAVRNGFLLPARVVMAVFRGKLLAAIRQAFARGALVLPEPMRPQQFINLLHRLGAPDEDALERADYGALSARGGRRDIFGTLPAGRSHQERPAGGVGWGLCHLHLSRPAGGGRRGARLAPADDLAGRGNAPQRWLLHVPVPQTRTVRCYGLYHATQQPWSALCRAALGQPPVVVPVGLDWQTVCAQRGDAHPERCPTCGQRLVCTGVIPRGGAPPRLPSEACAA